MNLIIDIGNTRTKLALFEYDTMQKIETFDELTVEVIIAFCNKEKIDACILSAVRDYHTAVKDYLNTLPFFIELNADTALPYSNSYTTPKTLGKDRLALVAGAVNKYPQQNVLVIDSGTCITYDLISEATDYKGGAISPGIDIRFKSLNTFTNQLPKVDYKETHDIVGKSTEESILSGVVFGISSEVDGMIDRYKTLYKNLTVIVTGGNAHFFVKKLKNSIFAHPFILLEGLNHILLVNAKK